MDSRSGFPHTVSRDVFSPHKPRRPGLDSSVVTRRTSADMSSTKPLSGKFNEKELMHGLNDRLAGFIEKVHQLEHHNRLLEREIEEIRGKANPASCLEEEYGPELGKLRQLVQDISHQKHQIEIEHQNLEEELSSLRREHERETLIRSEAESNIMVLKRDISEAYQAKLQLDKKAQSLVDEIHFLKRNHEAEVSEMFSQIQDAQVNVKDHEFGHPDVTAALRDIRAQLEGHTVSDVRQIEETFRSQFARLTEAAEAKREALKASQQEIQEYRKRLQAKSIELESAKGTREALEEQLHDVEDRHKEELIHYQNAIKELENELINCKFDMSGYLREYQDLLNVKMALDVEILSYRKLLCGEEARLSTMSDSHISLPHIYHQSPVYTLPCFSRPGGPHRRVEPQYKFVEEIITETTREIEMSEFEETGSEETEVGKDEQESNKSEKGGIKEEGCDKDTREEEGIQMCDSQQNEIASAGPSVNEDDDKDGERPDVVEDDAKSEKSKDEPAETEVLQNDGDTDGDKNTQSKVSLRESLDEEGNELLKADENAKEKIAAVMKLRDQSDHTSKQHELKPEVPVEGEALNTSEDEKQGSAVEENLISVQDSKPADAGHLAKVSEESDKKNQEYEGIQEQDQIKHLASETAKRNADITTEKKSSLSTETEKADESSRTSKKVEKEKEPKEISKVDIEKGEDKVAKNIQDVTPDSKTDQDSTSSGSKEEGCRKDTREKEGIQMCDSQQNEIASAGPSVNEDDDKDGERADVVEDDAKSEKSKDEPAETEVLQNDGDKNTQSKVSLRESLDEEGNELLKADENAKEKIAAVMKLRDQSDHTSKQHELKPEVPVEGEALNKSEDEKQGSAVEENLISVQDSKPADAGHLAQVSEESDKNQEYEGIQEQDQIKQLASETAKRNADITEKKSSLSTETEKADESSRTSKKVEKEPKEIIKVDIEKGEDKVAKNIQDVTPESKTDQDSTSSVQSTVIRVPEVDSQLPHSGDTTQTVQTALPKEKMAVIAENKDQGAPESSQIQTPRGSEDSKNK